MKKIVTLICLLGLLGFLWIYYLYAQPAGSTGSEWIEGVEIGTTLDTLKDVNAAAQADGYILQFNSTSDDHDYIAIPGQVGTGNAWTGNAIGVAYGGTGACSWTANRLLYPITTTSFSQVTLSTNNAYVLHQNTTGHLYWHDDDSGTGGNTAEQIEDVAGKAVTNGTQTLITITYQDTSNDIDFVVDGNLENYTNSAGWLNVVNLTSDITGTLAIANGGTGKTSFTANALIIPDTTTSLNQIATPGTNKFVLSGNTDGSYEWITQKGNRHLIATFDPGSWYDSANNLFLLTVGNDFPYGLIIDEWKVSFNLDPDVELNADLCRADNFISLGSAANLDALDTSAGISSEANYENINSGNPIAKGNIVYIQMESDPEGTGTQMIFEMWFHGNAI